MAWDGTGADCAAVEAMRRAMDEVHMDGTIVIGEGERDEAPMLYIGEKVGGGAQNSALNGPMGGDASPGASSTGTNGASAGGENANGLGDATEVDIAVDPLEGTNLVARGADGAISVLAVAERGGLLHAPDIYMEKLCVGPTTAGKVRMNYIAANLRIIADSLHRHVEDITGRSSTERTRS